MKFAVVATIGIVAVCIIAGIVVTNIDNTPQEETVIVTPTVAPTPTPVAYVVYYNEFTNPKYPEGTKLGEEIPPTFVPMPK